MGVATALLARKPALAIPAAPGAVHLRAPLAHLLPQLLRHDPELLVLPHDPLGLRLLESPTPAGARVSSALGRFQIQRPAYFSLSRMRLIVAGDQPFAARIAPGTFSFKVRAASPSSKFRSSSSMYSYRCRAVHTPRLAQSRSAVDALWSRCCPAPSSQTHLSSRSRWWPQRARTRAAPRPSGALVRTGDRRVSQSTHR